MSKESLSELKQELEQVKQWLNGEGSGKCEHTLCEKCGSQRYKYIKRQEELIILITSKNDK
jgi:hypothetical protein